MSNYRVDYGRKPGKIAAPMLILPLIDAGKEIVTVECDEWVATYRRAYLMGGDVSEWAFNLEGVEIKNST